MKSICVNLLLLTLVAPLHAGAYLVNGEMLLNDIEKRSAAAAGYVEGVTDTLNTTMFCIPAGTGTSQLKAAVKDYLVNNPALSAQPAARLVSTALKASFPCDDQ
ncbi:Rap1a/Tai family immunity protein [Enterobacter roggenkampii]